jgi:hypothetical protein
VQAAARIERGDGQRAIEAPSSRTRSTTALPPPGETSEENLLERLVADFLAGEDAPHAGADGESTNGAADDPALPARGNSENLPATRGARSPARTRLIDRAPELRRGGVKLLGSDRTRRLGDEGAAKLPRPSDRALPKPPAAEDKRAAARQSAKLSFPFMLG